MNGHFPAAIPEIPVSNTDLAAAWYKNILGFNTDWGGDNAPGSFNAVLWTV